MSSKIIRKCCLVICLVALCLSCKMFSSKTEKTKQSEEKLDLYTTQWQLLKIGAIKPKLIREEKYLTITFDKENSYFSGFSGCNKYFGNYALKNTNHLSISNVNATKMACPENDMSIEEKYLPMLQRVDNYTINKDTLFLKQSERVLLTFIAKG